LVAGGVALSRRLNTQHYHAGGRCQIIFRNYSRAGGVVTIRTRTRTFPIGNSKRNLAD
jgi:hypothetical protein